MSLRSLITTLARDKGIEIDDDELDGLGLADDDVEIADHGVDLSTPLPGRAAGEVEIFLAAGSTSVAPTEEGELLWEPIAREGQWAVRPDGRGGKKQVPLKIIAGRSKDQRREIGLQDVLDAFDDGAIEHVTIPESHENKPTENHGYIEAVKIVKGKVKDSGKDKIVSVLMGGYNFLDAKTKEKAKKGLIPSRSAGFLYDYQRTDTAKVYPVALEHVALTSKPWLRGMPRFGRKLLAASDSDMQTVPLTLSDEGPTDDEYVLILAEPDKADDFLAEPTIEWSQEEDPEWLKHQVNAILSEARQKKRDARKGRVDIYVEDRIPNYRCESVKPGSALIRDDWGDNANHWVAPISIVDGAVQLGEFSQWKQTKRAWVPDERPAPTGDKVPLSDVEIVIKAPEQVIDPLKFAQKMRLQRSIKLADATSPASPISSIKQDDPPRGGGNMADESGTLQLSEEARALIKAAEDAAAAAKAEAAQAKADNLKLAETVDRLVGTANGNEADAFIKGLKSLGLDEEHGYGGMLVELHAVLLHDDHGPAIQAEHFADDRNKEGVLSVTGAFKRVFGALKAGQDGKLALGEVVKPPSEKRDDEPGGGKPSKGDVEVDESNLSDDELLADEDPVFAQRLGYQPVGTKSNGSSKDGE